MRRCTESLLLHKVRCWLGLCVMLLLLGGCRSGRVGFEFAPTLIQSALAGIVDNSALVTDTVPAKPIVVSNPRQGMYRKPLSASPQVVNELLLLSRFSFKKAALVPVSNSRKVKPPHSNETYSVARCQQYIPQPTLQRPATSGIVAKPKGSIDDPPWGGIILLLGGVLCVAAVISGINIGGWLGLGAGILGYLAGAYLIARGFAGPDKPASTGLFSTPTPSSRKTLITRGQAAADPPAPAVRQGKFLVLLGCVLMIGGIVLGLYVGSWTGLGLFLLLFLVGCFTNLYGIYLSGGLP